MRRKIPSIMRPRLDPQSRRRKYIWSIVRSVLMLIAMVALGVTFAVGNRSLQVLDVVPATALYDNYQPVEATDVFEPDDVFFVSVRMNDFRPDMELAARWSYQGEIIAETKLDPNYIDAGDGTGHGEDFAGFVLMNDDSSWPVGNYIVEIVYEGEVLGSAKFRVEQ
ncbi:MAG: hypothetical protein JXB30_02005 [Anaerolineae bacterium]|nr:hypothetical protein [Anaerolineae bacterium]